jgi:hypothetical protein
MKRGAWGAALLLVACGGASGAPPRVVEEEPPPRPTTINLDRADPFEALSVAEQLLDEPVLVDAMSLVWLRCVVVDVKEPTPLPRRVAAERLFEAMRAQGVRIERLASSKKDGSLWIVKMDERPASCPPAAGEMPAARGEGDAGASDASSAAPAPDAAAVVQEVLRGIREISPTDHAITARALDLLLENEAVLMRQARIVPEQVDGSVAGIRLFGIRPDSVLGRLGFENGDRLERLMGKSVASPDQALEAYALARGAKVIDIEVSRRGTPKKRVVRVE